MTEHHLATYLNDHLSGSDVALGLLEHLNRTLAEGSVAHFATELRGEITADRHELQSLMSRLEIAESRSRKAAAWLSEKVTELKLRMDDRSGGPLCQLEIWDALSIGIEGKRLLWRALAEIATIRSDLVGPDYSHLEGRAEDQRRNVEKVRLEAAKAALGLTPSTV